ncbi:hypothetical protein EDD18DRAFT_1157011 [Armillaria luteobubalina]|uniref:Uncharacterized protein n=1 Tax=Armillaria luteobubalina TaxID=153913 RepID=A0AA39Q9Z7_9AGAR|nr:hypothetical protein EDD18DRAFT_1157011 [Armillaria luteobubalina]
MSPKYASAITSWASCLVFSAINSILSFILNMFASTVNWSIMVVVSVSSAISESRCWRDPMEVAGDLILDALSTLLAMTGLYQILKEAFVALLKFDVWMLRDNIRGQMYAIQAIGNIPAIPQPFQMCTEGYRSSQADILNSLEILYSFIITPSTRMRDLVEVNKVLQAYKERLSHLQNSYKAMCQGLNFTSEEDARMTMAEKWTETIRGWQPPSLPVALVGQEGKVTI